MSTSKQKFPATKKQRLEKLLQAELERLEIALAFEKEKKVVFPETTQIVRDILRIEQELDVKPFDAKAAATIKKKQSGEKPARKTTSALLEDETIPADLLQ